MSNTPVVTAVEAYDLVTDPDVILFYNDSQVEAVNLSDSGIYAMLELADGSSVEVLTAATMQFTRASWWDGSEDGEQ